MKQLPKLISAIEVGELIGWTTRKATRWLRISGLGTKVGGRYYLSTQKLIDSYPELLEVFYDKITDDK